MLTSRCKSASLFLHASRSFHDVVWQPATDIYCTPLGWLVKMDLAGVRPEDIQIQVQGCRLSVKGIRSDLLVEEGCHYYSLEISYAPFARQLDFPEDLSEAELETEYHAGMLLVRIHQKGRGHERSR